MAANIMDLYNLLKKNKAIDKHMTENYYIFSD